MVQLLNSLVKVICITSSNIAAKNFQGKSTTDLGGYVWSGQDLIFKRVCVVHCSVPANSSAVQVFFVGREIQCLT